MDKSKPILVTGATGYVAGWIIERLLNQGHIVHATVRDPSKQDKIQHLYDVHPPIKKRVDKLLNSVELYESLAKNDKTSIKKIIDKTILEKNDN